MPNHVDNRRRARELCSRVWAKMIAFEMFLAAGSRREHLEGIAGFRAPGTRPEVDSFFFFNFRPECHCNMAPTALRRHFQLRRRLMTRATFCFTSDALLPRQSEMRVAVKHLHEKAQRDLTELTEQVGGTSIAVLALIATNRPPAVDMSELVTSLFLSHKHIEYR